MKSGIICLNDLYVYAKENECSFKDRKYTEKVRKMIKDVPNVRGWYLWIKLEESTIKHIYVGQSDSRITSSLKVRLSDELREEKTFAWKLSKEKFRELCQRYSYAGDFKRPSRKKGSTHIIWVSDSKYTTKNKLDYIELLLIKAFKPKANISLSKTIKEGEKAESKINGELNSLTQIN